MLHVANPERYARNRAENAARSRGSHFCQELLLPAILFGSVGAIAWAIRGTSGWGGIDGTIVPGMMWGILWYFLCWRKGIACHGVPLWLGLGIALGGELGYGQYVSWIRGEFFAGDEILHVNPAQGWAWFFLCGIGWGAPGGVLLGWAISARSSWRVWFGRLTLPFAIAALGWLLVQWLPALFFPHYALGIYTGELDAHLERTVQTNTQTFTVVAWWAGAVILAALQRDKTTWVLGALIGGGFGLGFMISAAWCLGYVYAPEFIDWWKVWELHAGFNLGALYALALYWCVRQVDKANDAGIADHVDPYNIWRVRMLFETLAVFLLVLVIYIEREPFTSLFLASMYAFFSAWLIIAAREADPDRRAAMRGRIAFLFCVFLFLFVTLSGATLKLGVVLELYPPEAVDQYDWPAQRLGLFLPMAVAVVLITIYHMARSLRRPAQPLPDHSATQFHNRIGDLITGLAAVGAVSIWPSKIGILYACVLCIALWSLNRLK
jgi:hypothetical protein